MQDSKLALHVFPPIRLAACFYFGFSEAFRKIAFGSFVVITLLLVWNFNSVTMTIRGEFDASLVPWPFTAKRL